jgi:RNA polymerase sigma-70 factor (ECF subfamily)
MARSQPQTDSIAIRTAAHEAAWRGADFNAGQDRTFAEFKIEIGGKKLIHLYRMGSLSKRQCVADLIELIAAPIGQRLRRSFDFRDDGELKDCFHEFILHFYQHEETYDITKPLLPFLWVMARNRTIDYFRREKRHRQNESIDAGLGSRRKDIDPRAPAASIEDIAIAREALEALSENERAVASLYWMEDLTLCEVAEKLGLRVSTVQGRINTARKRLLAFLTKQRGSVSR